MSRHELYDDQGNVTRDACPRCENTYLANHQDRKHCGSCGYTEWL